MGGASSSAVGDGRWIKVIYFAGIRIHCRSQNLPSAEGQKNPPALVGGVCQDMEIKPMPEENRLVHSIKPC